MTKVLGNIAVIMTMNLLFSFYVFSGQLPINDKLILGDDFKLYRYFSFYHINKTQCTVFWYFLILFGYFCFELPLLFESIV